MPCSNCTCAPCAHHRALLHTPSDLAGLARASSYVEPSMADCQPEPGEAPEFPAIPGDDYPGPATGAPDHERIP